MLIFVASLLSLANAEFTLKFDDLIDELKENVITTQPAGINSADEFYPLPPEDDPASQSQSLNSNELPEVDSVEMDYFQPQN